MVDTSSPEVRPRRLYIWISHLGFSSVPWEMLAIFIQPYGSEVTVLFVLSQPDGRFPASESTVVWTFPECVLLDLRVPAATAVFLTSSCHGT